MHAYLVQCFLEINLWLVLLFQDTYVLHDYNFRLLTHISHSDQYKDDAAQVRVTDNVFCLCLALSFPQYLAFTSGMLAGALTNLGIKCQVTAEITTMPQCKYKEQNT